MCLAREINKLFRPHLTLVNRCNAVAEARLSSSYQRRRRSQRVTGTGEKNDNSEWKLLLLCVDIDAVEEYFPYLA